MTSPQTTGPIWHSTTILAVRKGSRLAMVGDGQVSMGDTVMKGNARKVRRLGGNYALAAARALYDYEPDAEVIARKAMQIAAEICVYTNANFVVETLDV
jgi:ATP-dependent protease HslVU (ClpYQ) peptidase subunit